MKLQNIPQSSLESDIFIIVGLENESEARIRGKKGMLYISFLAGLSDNDVVDYRRFP
jgi:hypothetical protein